MVILYNNSSHFYKGFRSVNTPYLESSTKSSPSKTGFYSNFLEKNNSNFENNDISKAKYESDMAICNFWKVVFNCF